MIAVIGSGEEVYTQPIVACDYDGKTGVISLLTAEWKDLKVDTTFDKVVIAEAGEIVGILHGVKHD